MTLNVLAGLHEAKAKGKTMQPQICAPVMEVAAACREYVAAFEAAQGPLAAGMLDRCLGAERRLIEVVTRKPPQIARTLDEADLSRL